MGAAIGIAIILLVSWIIVRTGAVALELTGMETHAARFQALSAFTGTGFTTRDSENVVRHPHRRRIIATLIILGNAGMISFIASLVQTFSSFRLTDDVRDLLLRVAAVALCLALLYRLVAARRVAAFIDRNIRAQLSKRTHIEPLEVEEILSQKEGWGIFRIEVWHGAPCVGKTLAQSTFRDHGILVLAIERNNGIIPAPSGKDMLHVGDWLLCYGQLASMEKLISRSSAWGQEPGEMGRAAWGGD
jgi:hypothetical protein